MTATMDAEKHRSRLMCNFSVHNRVTQVRLKLAEINNMMLGTYSVKIGHC